MSVTAVLKALARAQETGTGDLGVPSATHELNLSVSLGAGTGAAQVDKVWSDTRTLGASATEDIDLAGVLTSLVSGAVVTFVKIKGILIRAAEANNVANAVQVTRPAANGVILFLAASDGIGLAPGDWFMWASPTSGGKTVTAATGDLLTVTNGAGTNSVSYDIFIVGSSV